MTHVLRIAHLRIAHHVANPEVGKREVHLIFKVVIATEIESLVESLFMEEDSSE